MKWKNKSSFHFISIFAHFISALGDFFSSKRISGIKVRRARKGYRDKYFIEYTKSRLLSVSSTNLDLIVLFQEIIYLE